MKFNISVDKFVNNLTKLSLVIPERSTLPILDNVLFDLTGNVLNMQATDLENFIRAKVEVEGSEDGRCAVPGKRLLDLVRLLVAKFDNVIVSANYDSDKFEKILDRLKGVLEFKNAIRYDFNTGCIYYRGFIHEDEKIKIIEALSNDLSTSGADEQAIYSSEYADLINAIEKLYNNSKEKEKKVLTKKRIKVETTDKGKMNITSANGKYSYYGESPDNFPFPEEKDDYNRITIDGNLLKRYISKVRHAANKDEIKKNMSGILLDIRKEELRLVATDGFRMGKIVLKDFTHNNPKDDKIIIPTKASMNLTKLIEPGECTLYYDNSILKLITGNIEIYCKLIDDTFPNYETVIPKTNDKRLKISKTDLMNSLKRISIFVDRGTRRAKFEMKSSFMTINADNPEIGAEGEEMLDCSFVNTDDSEADFDAEPFLISFNVEYLLEGLAEIETDDVVITLGSPSKAAILLPGEQEVNEEQLELIMPVRVG